MVKKSRTARTNARAARWTISQRYPAFLGHLHSAQAQHLQFSQAQSLHLQQRQQTCSSAFRRLQQDAAGALGANINSDATVSVASIVFI